MKTYKDIYRLPLKPVYSYLDWVYDQDDNFVFQFISRDTLMNSLMLDVINGNHVFNNVNENFHHEDGQIFMGKKPVILIRGWGNLTGNGSHNLAYEDACNIQDTFAEFVVDQLNKR